MRLSPLLLSLTLGVSFAAFSMQDVQAGPNCDRKPDHHSCSGGGGDGGGGDTDYTGPDLSFPDPYTAPSTYYGWMHQDVGLAHSLGYIGATSHLIIVDDHLTKSGIDGNLDGGNAENNGHGFFTSQQAHLVAPGASRDDVHWDETNEISTYFSGTASLNVINMSYGQYGRARLRPNRVSLGTLGNSIVNEAKSGTGVFAKAAGNTWGGTVDGIATMIDSNGNFVDVQDYMNLKLIGAEGALFVGALDGNGTDTAPASIADYSTIAGGNSRVQNMFLVVGVDSSAMGGLAGTSFAAPIVSGYAAIIGDKFKTNLNGVANPGALVVDQLLLTARKDTILNYSASVHGMGEADLSRALAPANIPY